MEAVGRNMPNQSVSLKETELCLALPGGGDPPPDLTLKPSGKRGFSQTIDLKLNIQSNDDGGDSRVGVGLNNDIKNIPTSVDIPKSLDSKDPAKPLVK